MVARLLVLLGLVGVAHAAPPLPDADDLAPSLAVEALPAAQERGPDVFPSFAPETRLPSEAAVGIVGALTWAQVDAALAPHRDALAACRGGGGAVSIRLLVGEAGGVDAVDVLPADSPAANCLAEAGRQVAFPALDGGGLAVVQVPVH